MVRSSVAAGAVGVVLPVPLSPALGFSLRVVAVVSRLLLLSEEVFFFVLLLSLLAGMCPSEVSLAGIGAALAGIEFS